MFYYLGSTVASSISSCSVQQDLVYDVTDKVKVHNLQEAIEREIRDHVMSLRSRFITRWNNNCGKTLHKILVRYVYTYLDTTKLWD